jgi:NCS1 family nucleobase:cation symporter-1
LARSRARRTLSVTRATGSVYVHYAVETRQVNGQVELADPASIAASPHANAELLPVPVSKRTWTTYNYIAIWMGMAHNVPSYLLASG